jgi:hypothetical protein
MYNNSADAYAKYYVKENYVYLTNNTNITTKILIYSYETDGTLKLTPEFTILSKILSDNMHNKVTLKSCDNKRQCEKRLVTLNINNINYKVCVGEYKDGRFIPKRHFEPIYILLQKSMNKQLTIKATTINMTITVKNTGDDPYMDLVNNNNTLLMKIPLDRSVIVQSLLPGSDIVFYYPMVNPRANSVCEESDCYATAVSPVTKDINGKHSIITSGVSGTITIHYLVDTWIPFSTNMRIVIANYINSISNYTTYTDITTGLPYSDVAVSSNYNTGSRTMSFNNLQNIMPVITYVTDGRIQNPLNTRIWLEFKYTYEEP